jgi:hypothetical protein
VDVVQSNIRQVLRGCRDGTPFVIGACSQIKTAAILNMSDLEGRVKELFVNWIESLHSPPSPVTLTVACLMVEDQSMDGWGEGSANIACPVVVSGLNADFDHFGSHKVPGSLNAAVKVPHVSFVFSQPEVRVKFPGISLDSEVESVLLVREPQFQLVSVFCHF